MRQAMGVGLKWIGRGLILAAPFVIVCALFLPSGIQFLNPVACPAGLELNNARFSGPNRPDNAKLEVVCTSSEGSVSAGQEIVGTVVALLLVGSAALYFSSRLRAPRYLVPGKTSTS